MQLTELIREDLIKINLEARDKWEAIEELVDQLISVHELSLMDRNEVVQAVFTREKSMSTGLEHGLAVPHGAVGCVDDLVAALGTCKGIPFESVDGQPAHLVILLLIPQGTFQRHVRTLAAIARMGSNPDMRQRVFDAKTPAEVMEALRQSDLKGGEDLLKSFEEKRD
jgi:mannitol/fructose-specific phosphotransferase system IIA component (Ntr-type)